MKKELVAKLQETYLSDGSLSQQVESRMFIEERESKMRELLVGLMNGARILPGRAYQFEVSEGFSPCNWGIGYHTGTNITISVELSEVHYDEAST